MSATLFRSPSESRTSARSTTIAVGALLFSLLLHLGTYGAVRDRVVSFLKSIVTSSEPTAIPEEDITRVRLYEESEDAAAQEFMKTSDPLAATTELPADLMLSTVPDASSSALPVPEAPAAATILPELPVPEEELTLPPPSELAVPDIIAITDARDHDLALPIARREIAAIERRTLSPDTSQVYSAPAFLPVVDAEMALSALPRLLASAHEETVTLPVPQSVDQVLARETLAPDVGPVPTGEIVSSLIAETSEDIAPAKPLDGRLDIRTSAFRPETDPGHVYFQIDITPRDAAALPDIPRDIVFVQDTSNSLGDKRLSNSCKAVSTALHTLKPTDRFNLCVFAATNSFLQPATWLEPTPENLSSADALLKSLRPGGNTDLFQSMHSVLDLPRAPHRAQIAILLTDGCITTGGYSRDSTVIGAFSRLNGGVFSVFTVNVNKGYGNSYLLDMLSFCDRGGNTAIAPSKYDVDKTILGVVDSIGQPILTNVRFNFDSDSAAEALPRLTSNLYRDRPLRLFGRVSADTPTFAFQARGDANGDKYDMVFEVNLQDSSTAEAPDTLPTEWATQRMYDLVATYAQSEDPAILSEMQRLGASFNIPIPHGQRLGVAP